MSLCLKNSRTRLTSVRPANFIFSRPVCALNSVANVLAKACVPAWPVWTSVPSMSNKTRRTMRENIRLNFRRRDFCAQKMVGTKMPDVLIHFHLRVGDFDEGAASIHADRAAGCDRNHCDFGSDAPACPESRQGDGA